MAEQVLVALDNSNPAEQALSFALSHFPESELIVFHALSLQEETTKFQLESGTSMTSVDELEAERREEIEQVIERVRSESDGYDQRLTVEVKAGSPARQIVSYAEEQDVDHIVIGNHGRTGASRILLGSVAEKVIRRAPFPLPSSVE